MKSYYQGRHARLYNRRWRTFTQRTQAEVLSSLEKTTLPRQQDRHLCILDVGCGTGLLLRYLAERFPDAQLYGVDASPNMLDQAQRTLRDVARVHLLQEEVGSGEYANLPFAPGSCDLITCTNTLHYFTDPAVTLQGWRKLLSPFGQVVIEDYILRRVPLPWSAFEWAIKLYDPQHVRLYSLLAVQPLCLQAGFHVLQAYTFPIDFFCQGWVVLLGKKLRGEALPD